MSFRKYFFSKISFQKIYSIHNLYITKILFWKLYSENLFRKVSGICNPEIIFPRI